MKNAIRLRALMALGVWGCTQNGNVGTDSVITGVVVSDGGDSSVPTRAEIVASWTVTFGDPDYEYVFGTGVLTETGFEFQLSGPPPSGALNTHEGASIGVGVLVAFEEGGAPAEGRPIEDVNSGPPIGASNQHAVLYRANDTPIGIDWADELPVGYSCGVGVEADEDIYASFAVIDCSLVEIRIGNVDEFEFVNWT